MAALTIFTLTLFLSGTRAVAQEKVLYNFILVEKPDTVP